MEGRGEVRMKRFRNTVATIDTFSSSIDPRPPEQKKSNMAITALAAIEKNVGTNFGRRKARYLVGEMEERPIRRNSLNVINEVEEEHIPDNNDKVDIEEKKKPHLEMHSQRLESCQNIKYMDSSDFVEEEFWGWGNITKISI